MIALAAALAVFLSVFLSSGVYLLLRLYARVRRRESDNEKYRVRFARMGRPEFYDRIEAGRAWLAARRGEDLFLTARDGLRLHGTYYENPSPAGVTVVLSHGFRSAPDFDFGAVCPFYFARGYDLLLIDQRAHGESEGRFNTFGDRERLDLCDWCNYVTVTRGKDRRILLAGISMGATAALLAAAQPGMTPSLCGVVADCGFTSPRREIVDILRSVRFPRFPIVPAGALAVRLFARTDLDAFSTVEAVKKLTVPVLFVHGDEDGLVQLGNTLENFNACASPEKELLIVPGAGHALSYLTDTPGTERALGAFLDSLFAPTSPEPPRRQE
ncbi:MAG: alpha/beta hydrolase [Oscillospiraceae bacterium]|nr:alpha/beta hydrolase [Oscillospiraceae bacterium]